MAAELCAIETSGAQETRPELSRRTGGWRSEALAGWGCPAWLVRSSQPVSTLSWSVGSEVGDATQLAGLVVALRHEDPKAYDGATLENGVHHHDLDEIRDDALRVADEALLPVALPGVGAAAPVGLLPAAWHSSAVTISWRSSKTGGAPAARWSVLMEDTQPKALIAITGSSRPVVRERWRFVRASTEG